MPTRKSMVGLVAVVALAVVVLVWFPDYDVYLGGLAVLAAMGSLGLNLLTGYAGQLAISNAALLGVGSYTAVIMGSGTDLLVVMIVGGAVAGVVGGLIALPSLRLRGMYLIFSTLALQYIAQFVFTQYDTDTSASGGHIVSPPHFLGWTISSNRGWFIFIGVVVALTYLVGRALVVGRNGREWSAVRQNELSAAIAGVDVTRAKVRAFVISSVMIGVEGVILAYVVGEVSASYYSIDLAVSFVAMIIVGGLGTLWGSFIGALIVTLLPQLIESYGTGSSTGGLSYIGSNIGAISTGIYGLLIILILCFKPSGIAGGWRFGKLRLRRTRTPGEGGSAAPEASDGPSQPADQELAGTRSAMTIEPGRGRTAPTTGRGGALPAPGGGT